MITYSGFESIYATSPKNGLVSLFAGIVCLGNTAQIVTRNLCIAAYKSIVLLLAYYSVILHAIYAV